MTNVTLEAHYDGESIQLDEPFKLPRNARLLVTVLEPASDDAREPFADLAAQGLARAYCDEEPDYGPDDLRRP